VLSDNSGSNDFAGAKSKADNNNNNNNNNNNTKYLWEIALPVP